MTDENAKQIADFIRSGKRYRDNIFEGYIDIDFKDGKFVEFQYQVNPYSGETREREYIYDENELIKNLKEQDYDSYISRLS